MITIEITNTSTREIYVVGPNIVGKIQPNEVIEFTANEKDTFIVSPNKPMLW